MLYVFPQNVVAMKTARYITRGVSELAKPLQCCKWGKTALSLEIEQKGTRTTASIMTG